MSEPLSADSLYGVIGGLYERSRSMPSISPAWLATQAMIDIGFPRSLHGLGYVGCHLQLRQIARSFCRRHLDPVHDARDADDLFPETLQERYPVFSGGDEEAEYVRREYLTDDQVAMNVDRLRRSGQARLKHADTLLAWNKQRRSTDTAA